ncbi:MAG: hypothetical protein U1E76_17995 [Planctomycetota bacterium]
MRAPLYPLVVCIVMAIATARAGQTELDTIWITDVNQNIGVGNYSDMNSCWSVQVPTGTADYFSVCFKVAPGIPNLPNVVDGLPVTGIAVSLCIPGGIVGVFPRIGVYYPTTPGGCTPDLNNRVIELLNVVVPGPVASDFIFFDTPEAMIAPGTPTVIAAIQLPPGDPGLVQIGGDSSSSISGSSYYSLNGYSTPGLPMTLADMGICIGQDNSTTTSCTVASRLPHGRLRVARGDAISGIGSDPGKGDRLLQHVLPGDTLRLSFFGPQPGDVFLLSPDDRDLPAELLPAGRVHHRARPRRRRSRSGASASPGPTSPARSTSRRSGATRAARHPRWASPIA